MDKKEFEVEFARDLEKIHSIIATEKKEDEFVAAGFAEKAEEKFKELVKFSMELEQKYKDSPMKISGFSITIGAVLVNSSVSINLKM